MSTDPALLKAEGQQDSLWSVTDTTRQDFERILRTVPFTFSINDCREAMDLAQIPPSARGGLFAAAVKAGLIAPQYYDGECAYPVRVPSTGTSAHKATVVVYNRHNYGRAA